VIGIAGREAQPRRDRDTACAARQRLCWMRTAALAARPFATPATPFASWVNSTTGRQKRPPPSSSPGRPVPGGLKAADRPPHLAVASTCWRRVGREEEEEEGARGAMDATLLQQAKHLIDEVHNLPLLWHARCRQSHVVATDCSRTASGVWVS